jgi:hypothetical protein
MIVLKKYFEFDTCFSGKLCDLVSDAIFDGDEDKGEWNARTFFLSRVTDILLFSMTPTQ